MKKIRFGAMVTILLLAINAYSDVEYTESGDDFSNEKIYSLKIPSEKGQSAVVFISCYPENKLNVQLAITGTMFPDDTADGGMIISTTHKFDKAEKAITSNWFMNLMKYKNAWYRGDVLQFTKDAIRSNQLNIRLNKRNDIFKFPLKGSADHLHKILSNCGKKI
jgi:hypothetical protein